jgi:hypothetical protein
MAELLDHDLPHIIREMSPPRNRDKTAPSVSRVVERHKTTPPREAAGLQER